MRCGQHHAGSGGPSRRAVAVRLTGQVLRATSEGFPEGLVERVAQLRLVFGALLCAGPPGGVAALAARRRHHLVFGALLCAGPPGGVAALAARCRQWSI